MCLSESSAQLLTSCRALSKCLPLSCSPFLSEEKNLAGVGPPVVHPWPSGALHLQEGEPMSVMANLSELKCLSEPTCLSQSVNSAVTPEY